MASEPTSDSGDVKRIIEDSQFRLRTIDILERVADAFVELDQDWRIVYANREACRINQKPLEEFIGKLHWEEWPAAIGTELERQFRRAVSERVDVHFEHHYFFEPYDVWVEVDAYPTDAGLSLFYRDISDAKRAETQLLEAQSRLEDALTAGGIATWSWDLVNERIVADHNVARLFSVSSEDAAGAAREVYLQAIHPEDRARVIEAIEAAVAQGEIYEVEYRVILPDGSHCWLASRGRVERDSAGTAVRLPGVVVDMTEQAKRREREQFLTQLAERTRGLTDPHDVIADAVCSVGQFLGAARCVFADIDLLADTCTIPVDYCANDAVESMAGTFPISNFGPFLVSEYGAGRTVAVDDVRLEPVRVPADYQAAYEAIGCRAFVAVPMLHSARLVSVIAVHSATPRRWKPEEIELLQTVVERTWLTVEVIRQQHALERESRERREADEQSTRILERITDAFMAFDHNWRFTYINDQSERIMARTREELLGRIFWDEFPAAVGSMFEREYRRAVDEKITVTFEDFYAPLNVWVEVRAYPSPDGLSVFYQDVTARKMQEAERDRLLLELGARADREALLNRISHSLRGLPDPDAVQAEAVKLLGEALDADRCYFAIYDLENSLVTIARDWRREGLISVEGTHRFPNTLKMFNELYHNAHTSVIPDALTSSLSADTQANMASLGLRSRVSVALVEEKGIMATLTAAMADGPRAWSAAEVALVEAVATQLRTVVEMARVAQREHNIATQLQEALQPELPGTVPGLALAKYYQPALSQSEGVGGDFYDVYAVEKGCTALVVGDLSGKGLAAAAQVSTVRNMLRAFLYSQPKVAEAVTELNRVLSENNLLTGFTTLFVGAYESATRVLNYVNCGQEPALVRRADTGRVELLEPTGPILGAIEGASYLESSVTLAPGDVVAILTDGLTEAGASRQDMLGIEGFASLLAAAVSQEDPQPSAEALMSRLADRVNEFARSGARDDMCLLVGVVQ